MRRIVTLALIGIAAATTAAIALAASSPLAVRESMVRAALAQSSVHWTSTLYDHGIVTRTADVSRDSGTEQITYNHGQIGTVQILLVNDTAYVEGDAVGIRFIIPLTEAQATTWAGQWISIPQGDQYYAGTADGLTLASIVHDATPRGRLHISLGRSNGYRTVTVRGTKLGVLGVSLMAHRNGMRKPVAFSKARPGLGESGRFSKWNEPVNVQAPPSSTPIATVRGS